jgi:glycosyltransferase involved in cell wall biosynthesis/GT2 family glycosyltransferase
MAKICFVSYDILGPIKNGGIGTAMTAAAEALSTEGHDVTILYPSSYVEDRSITFWAMEFKKRGIIFQSLFSEEGPLQNSYLIYQWLKTRKFDVVHFHDWRGAGYWSCVAKRQNIALQDTILVCQIHGQTYWHLTNSSEFLSEISQLELDFIERRAVELADFVYSPSQYMLDWMRGRGWHIPDRAFVSPNLLPDGFLSQLPVKKSNYLTRVRVQELVFFGRLETRKGVELFCASVNQILSRGVSIDRVTFLGKEDYCGLAPATAVILQAAATWTMPYNIINNFDLFDARRYLAQPGRLAVIASVVENSPYTVLESLASGLPFIAADVGGVAELINPLDRNDVLFARTPDALADKLIECLTLGARVARSAVGTSTARQRWIDWHDSILKEGSPLARRPVRQTPRVSVCISHFSRPALLRIAVDSIKAQTYGNIQLVLLDDASPDTETNEYLNELEPDFAERGWKIIRNETEVWTGAARNIAVSHADGEYVLLMDDDNVARSDEVATFVTAALATDADILTCQMQSFVGTAAPPPGHAELPIGWMAMGPNLSQALYQNCLGDLNMMVRRPIWDKLGGFTTDLYGCEDWEFLVKAVVEGYALEVIPEMLFYYRHSKSSLAFRYNADALYKSNIRQLRPVMDKIPPELGMALQFAVEARQHHAKTNRQGYWRKPSGVNTTAVHLGNLPLNTGAALTEMAKIALRREQFDSAILLYKQALRNSTSNRSEILDQLANWTGDLSTQALTEFLHEPILYEREELLPFFLKMARLLEERGQDDALKRILTPAAQLHPANQTLRMMLGFLSYRLGEQENAAAILFGERRVHN